MSPVGSIHGGDQLSGGWFLRGSQVGEGLDLSVFPRVRVVWTQELEDPPPHLSPKLGDGTGWMISFLRGFGSQCLLQRPWSPHRETPAQPAPGPICSSLVEWETAGCAGSLV